MTDDELAAFFTRMREHRHRGRPFHTWTRDDYESYLHEVIRPGAVLSEETVFIVGNYLAQPERATDHPKPQRELRLDGRGQLDDVVIDDVKLFRLERMDDDRWWMRLYMREGDDYVFDITIRKREIVITVETETP